PPDIHHQHCRPAGTRRAGPPAPAPQRSADDVGAADGGRAGTVGGHHRSGDRRQLRLRRPRGGRTGTVVPNAHQGPPGGRRLRLRTPPWTQPGHLRSGALASVWPGSLTTTSPSAWSIRVITSSVNCTPAASTLLATCSGREAPTSAAATLSLFSTQAIASWAMLRPTSSAIGASRCTAVSTSSVRKRLIADAPPPCSSVALVPSGNGSPGLYLPDNTPWAIGDQTIWLIPRSAQVGTTSGSITRHSIEYCGCEEISWKPSSPASAWPSRICSAVHSLTPM